MHVHGASMNLNAASLYAGAAAEKAAEARRAAEVRKKLLKASARIEGGPDSGEDLLIGRWAASRDGEGQGEGQEDDDYRPSGRGAEPDRA